MSKLRPMTRSMARAKASAAASTSAAPVAPDIPAAEPGVVHSPLPLAFGQIPAGYLVMPTSPKWPHIPESPVIIAAPPTFDFGASLESAMKRAELSSCESGFCSSLPRQSSSSHQAPKSSSMAETSSPVALPASASSSIPAVARGLSRQQQYQNLKRMKKRAQQSQHGLPPLRLKAVAKHLSPSVSVLQVNAKTLPHSKPGWIGLVTKRAEDRVYTVQELEDLGFRYQAWDGSGHMLMETQDDRGFLHFIGRPQDPDNCPSAETWAACTSRADAAMETVMLDFNLRPGDKSRGKYPVVSCGMNLGGGPKEPHDVADSKPAERLLDHPDIKRIAHFQSSVFATSAPKLYAHYHDVLQAIRKQKPGLKENFPHSIFPTIAFNCGGDVVTHAHVDSKNVSYGLCAITALGCYDHTKGGHIYFWELKLIVEFPPGATVLVPSAALTHGNTPIQPSERRASVTQYMAGSLVRYVDYGCQVGTALEAIDPDTKREVDKQGARRWKEGLELYSKLNELKSDIDASFSLSTL